MSSSTSVPTPWPALQHRSDPDIDIEKETPEAREPGSILASESEATEPTPPALPPADVGLLPWLQVLGGFFLMFNSWGILLSWGTFQAYYTSGGLTDNTGPSSVAWIGSIQSFLLLCAGALGGKFVDSNHWRPMLYLGTFLIVFGTMMVSLSTRYYQIMLAQGICVGLGFACFSIPAIGVPATWFVKHRGLAVGLVTVGTCFGGVAFPIMLRNLIPRIGFPWAVRVMGFIALATSSISLAVMRQRLPPRKRAELLAIRALRQPEFALYNLGYFFAFFGFFMLYAFIDKWAIDAKIDMKGLDEFYILSIANAAGAFGRLVPNIMSDYLGPLNMTVPAMALSGVMVLVWLPVHTVGPLLVIAILYGFFSGTIAALPAPAVATMTTDMTTLGGRLGLMFCIVGVSSLIGNPVTGAIIEAQGGSYDGARIFAGVMMLTGAGFVALGRMLKTHWKLFVEA